MALRSVSLAAALTAVLSASAYGQSQPGTLVYVPNSAANNVSVYRTNADGSLTSVGTVAVGTNPTNVVVRGDQAFAYVSNTGSNTISVIDTRTQTVVQTFTVSAGPMGMTMTPDGANLLVASGAANRLNMLSVNATTGQVVSFQATDSLMNNPTAVAFVPGSPLAPNYPEDHIYVLNTIDGTSKLTMVRAFPFTALGQFDVGDRAVDVVASPDGARLYIVNGDDGTVSVMQRSAPHTIIATIPTGGVSPQSIRMSADGSRFYVTHDGSALITEFNTATNAQIGAANATSGSGVRSLALGPDGRFLYSANRQTDGIDIFPIDANGELGARTSMGIGLGDSNPSGLGICGNGNGILGGGTFVANDAAALNCTGPQGIVFTGGTLRINGAGLSIGTPIAIQAIEGGVIDTNGNNATFGGAITSTGTGSLTKAGAGTLTLTGTGTYAGPTLVNAGMLQAGAANVFSPNSSYTLGSSGRLDLNNLNQSVGALAGEGEVLLGSGTLTTGANNASTTFSGLIIGSGGLTKTGTGTFTLTGTLTYTGATNVNGGTLRAGGLDMFAASSSLTVAAGATFDLNNFNQRIASLAGGGNVTLGPARLTTGGSNASTTFLGVISGTGELTKIGTGTFTLSGSNTYTGQTQIHAGVLQAGRVNTLSPDSTVYVGPEGTFDLNNFDQVIGALGSSGHVRLGSATLTTGRNHDSQEFSGEISGTGGLRKVGIGTLRLSGHNPYTGATTVAGGWLYAGAVDTFAPASAFTVASDARVELDGRNQTIGSLAGAGTVSLGTATLTTGGDNTNTTFSGNITGTGGLTKTGTGVMTFAAPGNTYSGATNVLSGTLAAGGHQVFSRNSAVTVSAGATLALNNRLQIIGSLSGAGTVTLGSVGNGVLFFGENNQSTTFSGTIAGAGGIHKLGTGVFTVTGQIATDGFTEIEFGTLRLGSPSVFTSGRLGLGPAGTFDMAGFDQTIMGLAGSGAIVNGGGTLQLNLGAFSGTISGSGGITKNGTGLLWMSGANSYTGLTTINGGMLDVLSNASLGQTSGVVVNSAGTLNISNRTMSLPSLTGSGSVMMGSAALTIGTTGTSFTFGGTLSGAGGRLIKTGSGILTLTGANTYTGGTTLSQGFIHISSAANLGTGAVTFAGGGLQFGSTLTLSQPLVFTAANASFDTNGHDITLGNTISGAASLTKQGAGTLTLSANNTYSGGTTIADGLVNIVSANNLGTGGITLAGGGLQFGASITLSAPIAATGARSVFDTNGQSVTMAGNISGSGGITKTGAGTLGLSGSSSYTGATSIEAGTLDVNSASALGGTNSMAIGGGAMLRLNGFSQSFGTISGSGVVSVGSATLSLGGGTFGGAINGSGAVIKQGTGTLTLTGSHGLTGNLFVNGGTLVFDGTLAGSMFVASGGIANATGAMGGTLDVNGTFNIGAGGGAGGGSESGAGGAGALGRFDVVSHVTFGAGSHLGVQVNAAGDSSLLVSGGAATVTGATLDVTTHAGTYRRVTHYAVASAAGGITGMPSVSISGRFDPVTTVRGGVLLLSLIDSTAALANVAETANGASIGAAFDRLRLAQSGDLQRVTRELAGLSDEALTVALDTASGEIHASATQLAVIDSEIAAGIVRERAQSGTRHAEGGPGRPAAGTEWRRGGWITLTNDRASFDASAVHGADTELRGFALGADWSNGRWTIGAGASYATGDLALTGVSGRADFSSPRAIVYAGLTAGRSRLAFGSSIARTTYETKRAVAFMAFLPLQLGPGAWLGGINRESGGSSHGLVADGWGQWTYVLDAGSWTFEPMAGLRAARYGRAAFAEAGADSLSLSGEDQSSVAVDADAALTVRKMRGRLQPFASIAYRRHLSSTTNRLSLQLDDSAAGAFTVDGLAFERAHVAPRVGLSFATRRANVSLTYDARLGDRMTRHGLQLGIGF